MVFEEGFEFDPLAAAFGIGGGIIAMIVMSNSTTGLIFKLIGFAATSVVCYLMILKMRTK